MADAILTSSASDAPPPDTVLLWLTTTVERDFEERGAFPELRYASGRAYRGAATLHFLSADEADSVLEDAIARERAVRRGMRNAYRAHIKSVQAAMREASERPAVFASPDAACTHKREHAERWCGTKDQLKAHGIQLDGPWPHEPGGKERWALARDSRGYKTSITRSATVWPGLYEAFISIPDKVRGATHDYTPQATEADLARRKTAAMPGSPDDFRAQLVDPARRTARIYHFNRNTELAS